MIFSTSSLVASFEGDNSIAEGDELGIFINNICIGSAYITDPLSPVLAFATTDDPTTEIIDGGQTGTIMHFKLLHFGREYVIQSLEAVIYEPLETKTLTFTVNGLGILENDEPKFSVSEVIPNPFSEQARITVMVPEKGHLLVEVRNSRGVLVKTLFDKEAKSQKLDLLIDGQYLSQGIYLILVRYKNEMTMEQVLKKVVVNGR